VVTEPGHGKSDAPAEPFSTHDTALRAGMDAFGIERSAPLGSAWGGMVRKMWLTADAIALVGPDRVAPLVFAEMLAPKYAARGDEAMIGMRQADRRALGSAVREFPAEEGVLLRRLRRATREAWTCMIASP
jgi:hypothetical protein